jgi:sugar lactone lactonase YvrE
MRLKNITVGARSGTLVTLFVLAAMALTVTSAFPSAAAAARLHPYEGRLTEAAGLTPYPFSDPVGVAVDGAGGIWVTDTAGVVDEFATNGRFERQTTGIESFEGTRYAEGVAWSDAAKLMFVSDSNHDDLWGYEVDGTYSKTDLKPPGLGGCCFIRVAADNAGSSTDGDLYVFTSHGVVMRLNSAGEPAPYTEGADKGTSELTGVETPAGSFGGPQQDVEGGIAVDGSGRLIVADGAHHVVDIFAPSGEFIEAFSETRPGQPLGDVSAVAVDPTTGDILVADPTHDAIDEFALLGGFVDQITEVEGVPLGAIQGLAVDASGRIYAADATHKVVDVFGPLATLPEVRTGAVSSVNEADTGLTVNGTVDTAGSTPATALTSCRFQYVTAAAFEAGGFTDLSSGGEAPCLPAAGAIPNDNAGHAVSAALQGLTAGVVYEYRLIAANTGSASYGAAERTPQRADVTGESTIDVSAASAELTAEIDTHSIPSTYRFEYITEAAYSANGDSFSGAQPATNIPVPDAPVSSGEAPVGVSQRVAGLSGATVYLYRARATNFLGPIYGPARSFTTQTPGSFALLDGRAWEMVSPPDKHGADLNYVNGAQAAGDGSAVTFLAGAPTEAEAPGFGGIDVQVLAARGPGGWESRDLAAPHKSATSIGSEYRVFSNDLSLGVLDPQGRFEPSISPQASEATPFLHTDFASTEPDTFCTNECYRPLVTGAPGVANVPPGTAFGEEQYCEPPEAPSECGPDFLGSSSDLRNLVLGSPLSLTPGAPSDDLHGKYDSINEPGNIYEWSDGRLTLVSVLPDGEPAPPSSMPVLGGRAGFAPRVYHAVSLDGSRVIWRQAEGAGSGGSGHLYLRYNATQPQSALGAGGRCTEADRACTVQLDQAQGGSGEGGQEPAFQTASADDSKIFFSDAERLTPDSGAQGNRPDLYECEVFAAQDGELECKLTDLTPETNGRPGDFVGTPLGASEDGSTVYFVASNDLTGAHENPNHERAEPGDCDYLAPEGSTCNLYRSHDGSTTFVADLSTLKDQEDWGGSESGALRSVTAHVSPNGEWLTFMSDRSLTGYDNRDAKSGLADQEVYLYHGSGGGTLVCASCNPSGARPNGIAAGRERLVQLENGAGPWAATLPGWGDELTVTRYLSDSGRLFFDSVDALVPQDTNGTEDVYEYEPAGAGTCTAATPAFASRSDGCIEMVSSGTASQEAGFVDASESGDDVFFLTTASLSVRDDDTSYDVYDARVGGSEAQPESPPACEGDSCQSPVQAPNDPTPSSLTFSGPGNVEASTTPTQKPKTTPRTKAERLKQALAVCRKDRSHKRRARCEVKTRKRHGAAARRTSRKSTRNRRAK